VTDVAWRHHRVLLLKLRGLTYDEVGAALHVSKARAHQMAMKGAQALVVPTLRYRLTTYDAFQRALWMLRMRHFNRFVARRHHHRRSDGTPPAPERLPLVQFRRRRDPPPPPLRRPWDEE
jgi:hypothetical protein